ncbi:MAG: diguanylate cyclase response regulator [Deltaproteobacteria bacterium]|nr:MAG: diguanylate cyclase response regulator [Deltaproteobacteria bacterium]
MNILIAEDEPVSRHLLEVTLRKWGYEVTAARDGAEAWEILNRPEAPNLVISDWMMPKMDGLELCRRVRGDQKKEYTYIIILTGKGKKEDIVKGLNAGADDYVIKPFDREELKSRVGIGERIISLEREVRRLASTDPLTGILNRGAFMDRLTQEINRCNRENTPLSLIMADIDHFKKVNDTHGHQAGDRVLQEFAETLRNALRSYDFVGRYGGEEFMICLPGTDGAPARDVAERIRKEVESRSFTLPDKGGAIGVTASFGVVSRAPESGEDLDMVIKRADKALYEAKGRGRNCVCMAR